MSYDPNRIIINIPTILDNVREIELNGTIIPYSYEKCSQLSVDFPPRTMIPELTLKYLGVPPRESEDKAQE